MPDFIIERDGATVEPAAYDVAPLTDTANPFGDFAVVKIDDRGGESFGEYRRGTRIDIGIDDSGADELTVTAGETVTTASGETDAYATVVNGGTYENAGTVTTVGNIDRFTGYVVERRELDEQGADALEVEAYSFDQFLRRNTVTNDQSGKQISAALQDIIEEDTPVSFDAAKVDVQDDQTLTRSYQGVAVENALRDFAFKSGNEELGVDDELDFFFRPRETVHIDRGIDDTQWIRYDIPELGKEAINEVEVWFDDGDRSVIVDDGTDKLDLQDNLGLPEPGTQRAELNRPLITNINDAEDIGRKYLQFRAATLSGTVTTFGLFDAEPGDTIDVTITPRGIDTEFVIAAIEYRWGVDETTLTIVENRGDVDDILADLSESVQRVEMRSANRDAPQDRITTTTSTADVTPTASAVEGNTDALDIDSGETVTTASGETDTFTTVSNAGTYSNQGTVQTEPGPEVGFAGIKLTNDGRRALRDAWTGSAPPTIDTIRVGTSNAGLSRSNTALQTPTDSDAASTSLPNDTTVAFTATVTAESVAEIGLEAADGTLIARATFEEAIDIAGDVTVTLAVNNDDSVSRGVITTDGQTAVRDTLADNGPAVPTDYAYGTGDREVAESDTALESETAEVSLVNVLIQSAQSQAEFENLVPAPDNDQPLARRNGGLDLLQSSFVRTAEDITGNTTAAVNPNASGFEGSTSLEFLNVGEYAQFTFENEYVIPFDVVTSIDFYIRGQATDSNENATLRVLFDGTDVTSFSFDDTLEWSQFPTADIRTDIQPGEHTVRFELESVTGGTSFKADGFVAQDDRFTYTFDNTLDANDRLAGPELFPPSLQTDFVTAETRRPVTEANFDLTATDTSGDFFVELANDGTTFTRVNNAETGSVTFADPEAGVDSRVQLSRFGSGRDDTPSAGFDGQRISAWSLFANPDAVVTDSIETALTRAVVSPGTATGDTLREAGIKSNGTLLTRHRLADFEVLADQRISSSETTRFTQADE